MDVQIDPSDSNYYVSAARNVVKKFIGQSSKTMDRSDTDSMVDSLSKSILEISTNSLSGNNQLPVVIKMPIDRLPTEEMRVWAVSKQVLAPVASNAVDEVQLKVTGIESIQETPYTISNQNWSSVETVTKAKDGVRGAWFYDHNRLGSVVVKGQENPEAQILGTAFLRCMGINAPDSKMVKRDSDEGRQLSALGEQHQLNSRNPTHYIVMDRVYGHSYGEAEIAKSIEEVTVNLEALGELAVYDLVLGNFDRFQLDINAFNKGNIMFENKVLRPIDTDCIAVAENIGFAKYALKKIIQGTGNYDEKIARNLAKNISPELDDSIFPKEKIRDGMLKAIERLVALGKNMDAGKRELERCCLERGCQVDFPPHVEDLLKHVRDKYLENKELKKV